MSLLKVQLLSVARRESVQPAAELAELPLTVQLVSVAVAPF